MAKKKVNKRAAVKKIGKGKVTTKTAGIDRVEGSTISNALDGRKHPDFRVSDTDILLDALEELSCLGNGEHRGNSHGNVIAQKALDLYAYPIGRGPDPSKRTLGGALMGFLATKQAEGRNEIQSFGIIPTFGKAGLEADLKGLISSGSSGHYVLTDGDTVWLEPYEG